jgi:hypothetical protein
METSIILLEVALADMLHAALYILFEVHFYVLVIISHYEQ